MIRQWREWLAAAVVGTLIVGCILRGTMNGRPPGPTPDDRAVADATSTTPDPNRAEPRARILPPLDAEPRLRVLVGLGRRVTIECLRPGRLAGRRLDRGAHVLSVSPGGGIAVDGVALGRGRGEQDLVFAAADRANVRIGSGRRVLRLASNLRLRVVPQGLAVLELTALETFLYGTLTKEVGTSWPLEALKAQCVAARSYAAARYQARHGRLWHLTAHERVDMAYAGFVAEPSARLRTAIEQTRGDLLCYRGMPLPAYFHACSGGRTESKANIWPERTCPDGVTDPAPVLPSVPDPFSEHGARLLRQPGLHAWRTTLPLDQVSRALFPDSGYRLRAVRVLERFADSKRVRRLSLDLVDGGSEQMSGHGFRMRVDPLRIRSTLWTECRIAGSRLVLAGRGFGHGVGMAQVSARAMAAEGMLAPAILDHFYPGTKLVRKW